ncbi:hypothetical protein, partial [Cupriavidus metallidurans]|uniref:hypothetical protein n=1 Tax=Cupriavidus metallidurans TaxID=119219 RepID=UPI001BDD0F00
GSGPSGGNTVEVRVLSWAPRFGEKPATHVAGFLFLRRRILQISFLSFVHSLYGAKPWMSVSASVPIPALSRHSRSVHHEKHAVLPRQLVA